MEGALIALASAVLVAMIGGYVTYLVARPKGTADLQTAQAAMVMAVNATFKLTINEVRGENSRLREDVAALRQNAQRIESQLRMEIEALWACVGRHERLLAMHGVPFEQFKYEAPTTTQH